MKKVCFALAIILSAFASLTPRHCAGQGIPIFGPEKAVEIHGLSFDAMEPFVSHDGSLLFFNSLNSGGNTNIYYATRQDDTTFVFGGLVEGCYDSTANHLDGVPSADSLGRFYWVSLRNYPAQLDNLHVGSVSGTTVTGIHRVHGNINAGVAGWIIMDACVNTAGYFLAYAGARFDFVNGTCGNLPCESQLGLAIKSNDSTFNKLPAMDYILQNVNNASYLIYAPQLSDDNLRLYFTRLKKNTVNTEICVAVRPVPGAAFDPPVVLVSEPGAVPEAPTFSPGEHAMYYHKKVNGTHQIFMRVKTATTALAGHRPSPFGISPNPVSSVLNCHLPAGKNYTIRVFSMTGRLCMVTEDRQINVASLPEGIYWISAATAEGTISQKFIKADAGN